MESKRFLTAQDVMEMLGVSLSYSYKLIRRLNAELPVFCACKMLTVFNYVGLILSPLKSKGKESKKSISSTSFALLYLFILTSEGILLKS